MVCSSSKSLKMKFLPMAPSAISCSEGGTELSTKSIHFLHSCFVFQMSSPADNPMDLELSTLTSLCPLDGDYWDIAKDLSPITSEFGLIKFKVFNSENHLLNIIDRFSVKDALEINKLEKMIDFDEVRAVEYFLIERCKSQPEISKVARFFGFACGVKDINELAHGLMLKEALNQVIISYMDKLIIVANVSRLTMTDLTIRRFAMGVKLGYSLMAYKTAIHGLNQSFR
ncbi:hypothetical protein BUALT_Bualt05G0080200 [Buddleja alternifolia]|uniref:Uncharacterized protein n=1 Tax=Buddleja alternifolia TaxID=168488 RepID=A0AAV6XHG4_9LAMI|nr:hypothetical protein BUALT_Bualt05G0080200 [Buddleja alternifolia]